MCVCRIPGCEGVNEPSVAEDLHAGSFFPVRRSVLMWKESPVSARYNTQSVKLER